MQNQTLNNWQKVKLGDLGKVITGKTPPTAQKDYFAGDFPFITPTDITDYDVRYNYTTERFVSEKWADKAKGLRIPKNSSCFVCIGSTIGKICLVKQDSFTNQQINSIVVDELKAAPLFIYYLLKQNQRGILKKFGGGGAAKPIINKSTFEKIELEAPKDVSKQRKIASVLSAFDDLIENNNKQIKILEEMAQAIYKEWFVHFRFPGYEKVKIIDSPLGKIPEGWQVVKVENLVERISSGKQYDNKTVEANGSVPVLDQGKSGIIGYHDDEPGVNASEDNPIIVFANHTCYQRLMHFSFSAIQNVLPFTPNRANHRDIYWLHYATKDLVKFNDYKGHWPEFMSKKLLLPEDYICKEFGAIIKPIEISIFKLEKENTILRQTRDLLLPKLMRGEIKA